jgi:hypothetical protein
MSNVSSGIKNWSTTEANNQPDTTDAFTITGDVRAVQVAVKYLYSQDTIASATTTDLGSKDAASLTVSGTTTITGLGTVDAGIRKKVIFSGALTLTHNGTSLILPGAANITTVANDRAEFESLGSGNWRCNYYIRGDGTALLPFTDTNPIVRGSADPTKQVRFEVDGLTTATTRVITVPDSSFTLTGPDLSQTFTNKSINMSGNTITGTKAEFDAACSDGNFLYAGAVTTMTSTTGTTITTSTGTQNFTSAGGALNFDLVTTNTATGRQQIGNPGGADLFRVRNANATALDLDASNHFAPGVDNTQNNGSAAKRWKEVFAGTGTINTSDARQKTAVSQLSASEINAARQLADEIGWFQFLSSVATKGASARHHIGMTVQRAIEIMQANGLDPFGYGFICYDKWEDFIIEHEAVYVEHEPQFNAEGEIVEEGWTEKVSPQWTELVTAAGDAYGFRSDQLNLFIAAGMNARLKALEEKQ